MLAAEFGDTRRADSILLCGNSNQEGSPCFYNQAEMFANNRMKQITYFEEEILGELVERYHPGEEQVR
jgi:hypothetical protein